MNNRSNRVQSICAYGAENNEKAEQIVLPSSLYLRTARRPPRTYSPPPQAPITARRKAGEAAELFRCLGAVKAVLSLTY